MLGTRDGPHSIHITRREPHASAIEEHPGESPAKAESKPWKAKCLLQPSHWVIPQHEPPRATPGNEGQQDLHCTFIKCSVSRLGFESKSTYSGANMTEAVIPCYLNQPFPTKGERMCMPFLLLPSHIPMSALQHSPPPTLELSHRLQDYSKPLIT